MESLYVAMTPISGPSERLYDRNFLIAFISQTCFVGANTLMAHYSRWIEFLGGDLSQVGWIMGICAALGLLLRPTMAGWINRLGARKTWAFGYTMFAIAAIGNLWIDDIGWVIYAIRSSQVLGAAIVFASGLTYITQSTPTHRRTEAIGIFGIGGFLGMLAGPFLGDLFLLERERANFSMLFVVAAAANLIPLIALAFLRPTESQGIGSSVRVAEFARTIRRHWPGMVVLVDFAFGVCMTAPFVFAASFIDQANLLPEGISVIGVFFLFYAGVAIVVRLSSRRLPDRIGSTRVLYVGIVFMSLGMFCYGLVDAERWWMIVIPAVLSGVGHSLMFHTMTSLTLQTFPSEVRGSGSALALMMLDLGTIAGAPLLGWVGERYGFTVLFASIGLICLGAGAIFAASNIALAKRELASTTGAETL
ncbi:MAG: MFS transporter [Rubripirellula sp.]